MADAADEDSSALRFMAYAAAGEARGVLARRGVNGAKDGDMDAMRWREMAAVAAAAEVEQEAAGA